MGHAFESGGPGRTGGLPLAEVDSILAEVVLPSRGNSVDLRSSMGRVLAADVAADRPVPSFDRVCMDGYALRSADFGSGSRIFRVVGICLAGRPRAVLPDGAALCLEVMTGSVLPEGCDAVVPVERTRKVDQGVEILLETVPSGANIHALGRDRRAGEVVIKAGTRIGPCEIAALASVGATRPTVLSLGPVAVVSSGDELVDPSSTPQVHQVRQSNVWALAVALERAGVGVPDLLHVADQEDLLRQKLTELGRQGIILLSGGVSMGRHDLVPSVLESLGCHRLFHGVAQQPGGPLWVGRFPEGGLVAGLPGNPVASLVCLARHVLPVVARSFGLPPVRRSVILSQASPRLAVKTRFAPVVLRDGMAQPVKVDGSGDWAGLVGSDGFVELPPGLEPVPEGTSVEFHPW